MKRFPFISCSLLFFSFFQLASAQDYAYTRTDVYLLKNDLTHARNIGAATYLLQIVKHSDTEYVCRYYNKFGPMLRQETYFDSGLTIPNGSFLWYDEKGTLDSEAVVYRGRKTLFTIFDDNLKTMVKVKFVNGSIYEKRDYTNNTYTYSTGKIVDLAEKEKAESDSLLQFKKAQADTSQIEAKFPGNWNKYMNKNLLFPDRFQNNMPVGKYIATVSFRVDKEGKVDQVRLLRSVEWSADLEIFRIVENSPPWTPAVQFGRNVMYRQKQNMVFQISH